MGLTGDLTLLLPPLSYREFARVMSSAEDVSCSEAPELHSLLAGLGSGRCLKDSSVLKPAGGLAMSHVGLGRTLHLFWGQFINVNYCLLCTVSS